MLALLTIVAALGVADELPAADVLIERYIDVTGGREAHEKYQARISLGKFEILGFDGRFGGRAVRYEARPNRWSQTLFFDREFSGHRDENGTDGEIAWGTSYVDYPKMPPTGTVDGETALIARRSTFDLATRWTDLYEVAATIGIIDVRDRPCYALILLPESGFPEKWYIDVETSLLVKTEVTYEPPLGVQVVEEYYDDYRAVDGVLLPHRIERVVDGTGSLSPSIPFRRPLPPPEADHRYVITFEAITHPPIVEAGQFEPPEETVTPALRIVKEIERPDHVQCLGELGRDAAPAVPALLDVLRTGEAEVRAPAAHALGKIGVPEADIVPALAHALRTDDVRNVRISAAHGLGEMGLDPEITSPILIDALSDADSIVRWQAAASLAPTREAVPALLESLRDENRWVRLCAAESLQGLGPEAIGATDGLIETLNDEDEGVVVAAVDALGAIRDARAVPALERTADEGLTLRARRRAVRALSLVAPDRNDDTEARIADLIDAALPRLIVDLRDDDWRVRDQAAAELQYLGPPGATALEGLVALLEDENRDVRNTAANALAAMGPACEPAIPALVAALDDDFYWVRASASAALGRIGPSARHTLDSLYTLLADANATVREHALAAIRSLLDT